MAIFPESVFVMSFAGVTARNGGAGGGGSRVSASRRQDSHQPRCGDARSGMPQIHLHPPGLQGMDSGAEGPVLRSPRGVPRLGASPG